MIIRYLFPTAIVLLSLGASVVYALARDWRLALYFLAGAVITACAAAGGR